MIYEWAPACGLCGQTLIVARLSNPSRAEEWALAWSKVSQRFTCHHACEAEHVQEPAVTALALAPAALSVARVGRTGRVYSPAGPAVGPQIPWLVAVVERSRPIMDGLTRSAANKRSSATLTRHGAGATMRHVRDVGGNRLEVALKRAAAWEEVEPADATHVQLANVYGSRMSYAAPADLDAPYLTFVDARGGPGLIRSDHAHLIPLVAPVTSERRPTVVVIGGRKLEDDEPELHPLDVRAWLDDPAMTVDGFRNARAGRRRSTSVASSAKGRDTAPGASVRSATTSP